MSIAVARRASRQGPAFLSQGFRPFFLAAGVWAAVALLLWLAMLTRGMVLPSRFDPLAWHIHEMLFGFVMAAIGGFLLTAIPNWTKRLPVSGWPLALLAGLWLAGRIACLVSAFLPRGLATAIDLTYPAFLCAVAAREIVAGRNWRNLPMLTPVAVLGAANLLMHLEANGIVLVAGLGVRLGLAAAIVLISVVAGRIVPSFTSNWLAKRGKGRLPAGRAGTDRAALGTLHAGLIGWAFLPDLRLFGVVLVAGALFNLWRLLSWRGVLTLAEPLLFVLHLGYAWLVLGAGLLGLSVLGVGVPLSGAVHALTAGAIGTMILAVMTRAIRGHTGRALSADPVTTAIYLLVTGAAACRVAAAFAAFWIMPLLIVSGTLWIAAFTLFVLAYGPMLVQARGVHP